MLSALDISSASEPQVSRIGGSRTSVQADWPIATERWGGMPPTAQRGATALASQTQVLEIEYGSARDFAQDFRANLANGGVFVATQRSFGPRDFVVVRLRMPWCSRVIDLEGEVVHIVSAEIAGIGVQPGVAVQFREPPAEIRVRVGPLCAGEKEKPPPKSASEERIAPRKSVRVPALLESTTGSIRGRTRNLSKSGVLIDVQEGSAAAGERVHVVLR